MVSFNGLSEVETIQANGAMKAVAQSRSRRVMMIRPRIVRRCDSMDNQADSQP